MVARMNEIAVPVQGKLRGDPNDKSIVVAGDGVAPNVRLTGDDPIVGAEKVGIVSDRDHLAVGAEVHVGNAAVEVQERVGENRDFQMRAVYHVGLGGRPAERDKAIALVDRIVEAVHGERDVIIRVDDIVIAVHRLDRVGGNADGCVGLVDYTHDSSKALLAAGRAFHHRPIKRIAIRQKTND
jgi:hypothetical protein